MHTKKKAPEEKSGKIAENGGWGEIFCDVCRKTGKTWYEPPPKKTIFVVQVEGGGWPTGTTRGGVMEKNAKNPILSNFSQILPFLPIFTYFAQFLPIYPPPHFLLLSPIAVPFFLALGTLWYVYGYITCHRSQVVWSLAIRAQRVGHCSASKMACITDATRLAQNILKNGSKRLIFTLKLTTAWHHGVADALLNTQLDRLTAQSTAPGPNLKF